jgi:alkaline phosphatase
LRIESINVNCVDVIQVILGGGRRELTPTSVLDPENNRPGRREDGKNLIETWLKSKADGKASKYVWTRDQLMNLNTTEVDHLMGT